MGMITNILVLLVVFTILMYIQSMGIKTLFSNISQIFNRDNPSEKLKSVGSKLSKMASQMSSEENPVKIINLTTGKCDSCGETFVGTTADTESPIHTIEFLGETRTLCSKCLENLQKEFKKNGQSTKKNFSESAEAFRGLFSGKGGNK